MQAGWTSRRGSASRRTFLKIAGGVAATGVLAGAAGRRALAADSEVVVVDSGGTTSDAFKELFFAPFTKETGIAVKVVATSSSPEAFAKLRAASQVNNIEWDILASSRATMKTERDLIGTLDCQAMPNWVAEGAEGSCIDTGLLRFTYGEAIAYNSKLFPDGREPTTWADFWDTEKFPGPRSFSNIGTPWTILAFALMADGVPAKREALFPLDVDRAFRKMDEIKPHVGVWFTSGAQLQQILRDEEVVMAHCWSGRVFSLIQEGVPVKIQWNQAVVASDFWSLAKGGPHPEAAMKLLDYLAGHPKAYAEFGKRTGYSGPNAKAVDYLSPEERGGISAPASAQTCELDYDWIAKNRDALVERFNGWLLA